MSGQSKFLPFNLVQVRFFSRKALKIFKFLSVHIFVQTELEVEAVSKILYKTK